MASAKFGSTLPTPKNSYFLPLQKVLLLLLSQYLNYVTFNEREKAFILFCIYQTPTGVGRTVARGVRLQEARRKKNKESLAAWHVLDAHRQQCIFVPSFCCVFVIITKKHVIYNVHRDAQRVLVVHGRCPEGTRERKIMNEPRLKMTEDSCLIVVFRWLLFFVRLQERRKLSSCC